ncbi:MAG: ParM/StbA family protein [Candidatus Woesearchaeota archaeon]
MTKLNQNVEVENSTELQTFNVEVGADAGNSTIKIMIGGHWKKHEFFMYDNVTAKSDEVDYTFDDNDETELKNMLDVTITSNNAVGNRFLFGEFAKKYRKTLSERVNNKKTQDPQLHLSTLTAIASSVVEKALNEETDLEDEIVINVKMCTGLPYEEWKNDNNRDRYKNLYLGTHIVEFENKKYPIRKAILNINDVDVEIEGLPALKAALGANKFADQFDSKEELIGGVVAMVDIGCYTTDMIGGIYEEVGQDGDDIKLGIKNRANLCTGMSIGVGTAAERTIKDIINEYPHISDLKISDIFKANMSQKKIIQGKRKSIEPFFSDNCYNIGKEIGTKFVGLFDTNGYKESLYHIYICGGGSQIPSIIQGFKDILSELRYDTEYIPVEILERPNPVHANTFGYYLTAKFK